MLLKINEHQQRVFGLGGGLLGKAHYWKIRAGSKNFQCFVRKTKEEPSRSPPPQSQKHEHRTDVFPSEGVRPVLFWNKRIYFCLDFIDIWAGLSILQFSFAHFFRQKNTLKNSSQSCPFWVVLGQNGIVCPEERRTSWYILFLEKTYNNWYFLFEKRHTLCWLQGFKQKSIKMNICPYLSIYWFYSKKKMFFFIPKNFFYSKKNVQKMRVMFFLFETIANLILASSQHDKKAEIGNVSPQKLNGVSSIWVWQQTFRP